MRGASPLQAPRASRARTGESGRDADPVFDDPPAARARVRVLPRRACAVLRIARPGGVRAAGAARARPRHPSSRRPQRRGAACRAQRALPGLPRVGVGAMARAGCGQRRAPALPVGVAGAHAAQRPGAGQLHRAPGLVFDGQRQPHHRRHLGRGQGRRRRGRHGGPSAGSGVRAVFCATRPPGHHAGADFWAATASSTTPRSQRSRCASAAAPAWRCSTSTTTTATARRASSTSVPTCWWSACTATRAPSIRSTWAMRTKPARGPGRAST